MSSRTKSLSRKPSTSNTRGRIPPTLVVQRSPSIISVIDNSKNAEYSTLVNELEEAGSNYIYRQEDSMKNNSFGMYEIYFGGSPDYFRSSHFDIVRRREREYLDTLIRRAKVVEGITPCPVVSCGNLKVQKVTLRLRGGDEPDVNQMRCTKCGKQWTVSK
jgi:hypothetical protein